MNLPTMTRRAITALIISSCVTACASKTPQLYEWQDYQNNVDSYFRGDKAPPNEQIQSMQEGLSKIQANGGHVPPGYNAHLGLLYAQQGNMDEFQRRLHSEKERFPESQKFMDFLTRNLNTNRSAP